MFLLQILIVLVLLFSSSVSSAVSPANPADMMVQNDLVVVTREDFEADMAKIPDEHRMAFLTSKKRISQLLENLVVTKTFAARARREGLDKDPEVRKEIELAMENVLARREKARAETNITIPDFEPRAREVYLVNKRDKYTEAAAVAVSHILLDTQQRGVAEALRLIQELRQRALNGESFEDLAVEYSDDPSAKSNRGNLGFIQYDQVAKPFADAAFGLRIAGEISEPTRTRFGYHLVQFHDRREAAEIPFEKVKEEIMGDLKRKYLKAFHQQQRTAVLKDPALKLNEAVINSYLIIPDYELESK